MGDEVGRWNHAMSNGVPMVKATVTVSLLTNGVSEQPFLSTVFTCDTQTARDLLYQAVHTLTEQIRQEMEKTARIIAPTNGQIRRLTE